MIGWGVAAKLDSNDGIVSVDPTPLSTFNTGDIISMPIAHRQGNYLADSELIKKLESNNQIAFKYEFDNLNGSISNIAGILNEKKNILGMMPHPERASEKILGSNDGLNIFKSILEV